MLAWFFALVWWEMVFFALIPICLFYCVIEEEGILAGVAFCIAVFWPFAEGPSLYEQYGWMAVISFVLVYGVVGILWSLFKWRRKAGQVAENFTKKCEKKHTGHDTISTEKEFHEKLSAEIQYAKRDAPFRYWILGWPFSVFGFFFKDLVNDLIKKLGNVYDGIGEGVVSKQVSKSSGLWKDDTLSIEDQSDT